MGLFDLLNQKQGFESLMAHVSDPPLKDAVTQIIDQLDLKINKLVGTLLPKLEKSKEK
ncbi:MAG: hypothetical protein ACOC4M_07490 [Promethearchaeia archaeon]